MQRTHQQLVCLYSNFLRSNPRLKLKETTHYDICLFFAGLPGMLPGVTLACEATSLLTLQFA